MSTFFLQPAFLQPVFYSRQFFYSHCEQTVTPLRSRSVPHCPALLPDSHRILTPAQTRHNTLHQSPLFSSLSHPPFTLLTHGHEKRYKIYSETKESPARIYRRFFPAETDALVFSSPFNTCCAPFPQST